MIIENSQKYPDGISTETTVDPKSSKTPEETVELDGQQFTHVKTRAYTPVSVYRGENSFLRIGPKDLISSELHLHRKLLNFGFPVSSIISEGEKDGRYFYVETSLGDTHFGNVFWLRFQSQVQL